MLKDIYTEKVAISQDNVKEQVTWISCQCQLFQSQCSSPRFALQICTKNKQVNWQSWEKESPKVSALTNDTASLLTVTCWNARLKTGI